MKNKHDYCCFIRMILLFIQNEEEICLMNDYFNRNNFLFIIPRLFMEKFM